MNKSYCVCLIIYMLMYVGIPMCQSWYASLRNMPNKKMRDLFHIKIFTAHPSVQHKQLYMSNPISGEVSSWETQSMASPGGRGG